MRMLLPPLPLRERVTGLLHDFFVEHDRDDIRTALREWAEWYHLPPPPIRWRRNLIRRYQAEALTWPQGTIDVYHPRNWKATEAQWVQTLLHEMGHYMLWADAERKADAYAIAFLQGLQGDRE